MAGSAAPPPPPPPPPPPVTVPSRHDKPLPHPFCRKLRPGAELGLPAMV